MFMKDVCKNIYSSFIITAQKGSSSVSVNRTVNLCGGVVLSTEVEHIAEPCSTDIVLSGRSQTLLPAGSVYIVWCHLYEFLEQAKLIYCGRILSGGCLRVRERGREWDTGTEREGLERVLGGEGSVLCLERDSPEGPSAALWASLSAISPLLYSAPQALAALLSAGRSLGSVCGLRPFFRQ